MAQPEAKALETLFRRMIASLRRVEVPSSPILANHTPAAVNQISRTCFRPAYTSSCTQLRVHSIEAGVALHRKWVPGGRPRDARGAREGDARVHALPHPGDGRGGAGRAPERGAPGPTRLHRSRTSHLMVHHLMVRYI